MELAHVHYWYWETAHPFILVLYDAQKHRAFWLDIQSYIERHGIEDQQTLTIRIPFENKLTVASIDRFRNLSLERIRSAR